MNEIYNLLNDVKGCTFVNVTVLTAPDMNKKGNPYYGRVKKLSVKNCQFNYSYENAVNNRLKKEGSEAVFESSKLPWGEWLVPNKFISHGDKVYVRFYAAKSCGVDDKYIIDGRYATEDEENDILKYVKKRPDGSSRQSEAGLSVEEQVRPWNVELSNIMSITASGKTINTGISATSAA